MRCEIEGRLFALVSAPALHDFHHLQHFRPMDYDGETLAERLSRRSRFWIPELEIVIDGGD